MFGFLTSDDNARGWVFFSAAPWQCSSRLMVVETADHDSSCKRKGREKKSVSRLDREKDESSDWERESISMVTTVMGFFFSSSHSPPPSLPVSSPLSFAPSSHVSVPRCYTISHLTCFFLPSN